MLPNLKMSRVKLEELTPETQELLLKLYKGQRNGFHKFGPEGYIMPAVYKEHADAVTRMQLRPDDIWVVTFPRSGTTWTQEMVWLLKNNLDYETANQLLLHKRYFFIEYFAYAGECWSDTQSRCIEMDNYYNDNFIKPGYILCASAASPRFIKTHLPLSLLPPTLLDTCKVVFVARDPRDVAYSYYQHNRMFKMFDFVGDFKTYWKLFQDNLTKFLGKEYNDEQIKMLCEHLDIRNLKNNQSVNPSHVYDNPHYTNEGHEGFIRKGKPGGWREHFDSEMAAQAALWMQHQLSDTGLRFPDTDMVPITMGDKVRIQKLDPATQKMITDLYKGIPQGCARFGEGGYIMVTNFKDNVDDLKNMAVRPDDVWVVTYPRSGTTWTQELVWLLNNNLDYEAALKSPLMVRYFFLEFTSLLNLENLKDSIDPGMLKEIAAGMHSFEDIVNAPSPRFIKTHLPLSLLPDSMLDTTKVVYVARDPRDVAVSFYHHNRLFKNQDFVGDFKKFWKLFVADLVQFSPFFPHLKEAWAHRNHPNMLFIFYEDLKKDLAGSINRIAKFFSKEITSEQSRRLCDHLDIKNFRHNEAVNPSWIQKTGNPDADGFVREGKSGGWYEYFDEEMSAQAQSWMRAQLAGTDLRFPDASSDVATIVSL